MPAEHARLTASVPVPTFAFHPRARARGPAPSRGRPLPEKLAAELPAFLPELLAALPAGIGIVDRELRFVHCNALMAQINGFSVAEHLGRRAPDLLPALAETLVPMLEGIFRSGQPVLDREIIGTTDASPDVRTWRASYHPLRGPAREVRYVLSVVEELSALRRTERQLQHAESIARLGSWRCAVGGGAEWWSDGLYELLGRTPGSVMPSTANLLLHMHPADRHALAALLDALHRGRDRSLAAEFRLIRADGTLRQVLVRAERNAHAEATHLTGTLQDITERAAIEAALRQSETLLKEAERVAQIGSWMHEVESGVTWWSDEEFRIFGRDPALGVPDFAEFLALIHPDDRAVVERSATLARTGADAPTEIQFRLLRPTGEERTIRARQELVRGPDGRTERILGNNWDITERVAAEAERRVLEAQMQQAQKLESLGVLAGGIAHDFNNLLVGILGNVDIVRADFEAGRPADTPLAEIKLAAQRAADLTRQLLAYAGKSQRLVAPLHLPELVRETWSLLRAAVSRRAVLQLDLEETLPTVTGDQMQLRQVLMNLITNASDALGDRDGRITVRATTVTHAGGRLPDAPDDVHLVAGTYALVEVADTGHGMDDATRARIFEPFFTTRFTGRGLGLAAVLGMIRAHRGGIAVSSTPGVGTRVRVMLPLDAPGASAARVARPTVIETSAGPAVPPGARMLVVDDEPAVRRVGRRLLELEGAEVHEAAHGLDALRLLAESTVPYALVVLDLTMPVMDGAETLERVRQRHPTLPVLLSSGFASDDVLGWLRHFPHTGFVSKPFERRELLDACRRLLRP
jgi:PAS domain S-box-containing protein